MSEVHPNLFAYFALLIWPVVALYLYSKFPIGQATLWTILGGYLLLPVDADIKFKMIPVFNKNSIPNLAALISCAIFARQLPSFFRRFGLPEVLIFLLLVGPFITSMLNSDPVQVGAIVLPGVGAYDAGSAAIAGFIFILPFFLGRQFLRGAEDNADILRVMVIAGLAYSLLMLIEVRMSPQLHRWIYGYATHSIGSEFRGGGFRPVVFLQNGLLVAFFAMTTCVASAALWRTRIRIGRLPPAGITTFLGIMLVFCKTLSAFTYGAVLVPLVRWASPRLQLRVACVFVIIALIYPMLRVAELFPTTSIIEVAKVVDASRAASLNTRFNQEERLLNHAWQRPWFGWGRYGRSRVYDAESGRDISITDGDWILTLGVFGLVGFVGRYGLFALAVVRAAMALKFAQTMQERVYLAALALIVAINVADLLPNASATTWFWLLVGALLGRAEALYAAAHQRHPLRNLKMFPMGVHGRAGRNT
jgi:hypothetical protein